MKKWRGIDVRLVIALAFTSVLWLWSGYGNLKQLIRLYAETALPLALVFFGLYSLIRLKNGNISKSIIIIALLAILSILHLNVIPAGREIRVAYPVIGMFIIYRIIYPIGNKEGVKSYIGSIKWAIPFAIILLIVLWYRYGNPYRILPYPADTGLLFALFFLGLYALWQIRNKWIALSLIILVLLSVSGLLYFDVINFQEKRFLLSYPIMTMLMVWGLIQIFQKRESEGVNLR